MPEGEEVKLPKAVLPIEADTSAIDDQLDELEDRIEGIKDKINGDNQPFGRQLPANSSGGTDRETASEKLDRLLIKIDPVITNIELIREFAERCANALEAMQNASE